MMCFRCHGTQSMVPRTKLESAKSNYRGQSSLKFIAHVEKLHPYCLIISVGKLSSPATRNFKFKF